MNAVPMFPRIGLLLAAVLLFDLTPAAGGVGNTQVEPTGSDSVWSIMSMVPPAAAPGGELAADSCAGTTCVAVGASIDRRGIQVVLAERRNGATWTIESTPKLERATSSRLQGVSCVSATQCTAVGYLVESDGARAALVERWDGARWSLQHTPELANTALAAVSCTAANACTAVGSIKTATVEVSLAERWDGERWTVQRPPEPPPATSSALTGVSCTSASACTAVGHFADAAGAQVALAERWNGAAWIIQPTSNPIGASGAVLTGVSCTSSTECAAVGFFSGGRIKQAGLAERWDGVTWTIQPTPGSTGGHFNGVSCTSPSACTAVGSQAINDSVLAETWDGTAWSLQTTPRPAGGVFNSLSAVSCIATLSCSAVGSFTNSTTTLQVTLAERQHGTAWSIETTPNPIGATRSSLSDVSCVTANACTSVGQALKDDGTVVSLAERWDGRAWSQQSTPNPAGAIESTLTGVACATSNSCMAVGSSVDPAGSTRPLVERWDGSAWTLSAAPTPTGSPVSRLQGVSCTTSAACTAVGDYKNSDGTGFTALAERWDGAAWVIQPTRNPNSLTSTGLSGVSCSSASACIAVGGQSIGSQGSFVVTFDTLAERWDGSAWTILTTPNPAGATGGSGLSRVSCTSSTACIAVGDYGPVPAPHAGLSLAERWDGSMWTLQPTPNPPGADQSPLFGVSCTSATSCTAVGDFVDPTGLSLTLAEYWNGERWTIQPTPNPAGTIFAQLAGISCTSTGICTAVGLVSRAIDATVPLAERSSRCTDRPEDRREPCRE